MSSISTAVETPAKRAYRSRIGSGGSAENIEGNNIVERGELQALWLATLRRHDAMRIIMQLALSHDGKWINRMDTFLSSIPLAMAAAWIATLPLAFAQASQTTQPATTPLMEQLKAEHLRVLDELNEKDARGGLMDLDDPRVPNLVRKGWDLAGAWAAEWLERHPKPSTRDLKRIFDGFTPEPQAVKSKDGDGLECSGYCFRGGAVRVGPSVYVAEGSYGFDFRTGTFMVLARNRDCHFQALWNIKDLAETHYAQRDEIGHWMHLVRRNYGSGPLTVDRVLRVYPAANGDPRFLVDAYEGTDGGTRLAQLSIWEWDGAEARPSLVEDYYYALFFEPSRFDGNTVRVSTKEELETLQSCGMCTLPKGTWTVRITPRGVRNLGHRFFQPEIQWADKLLSKLTKQEDATNLANAKVLDALKALMHERPEAEGGSARPPGRMEFWFGLFEGVRIFSRGPRGSFLLATDEAQLHFRYMLRKGRPYFTRVKVDEVP